MVTGAGLGHRTGGGKTERSVVLETMEEEVSVG